MTRGIPSRSRPAPRGATIGVFAAATVLVVAGCSPESGGSGGGSDDGGAVTEETSAGTGDQDAPELAEIGTSGAADLPDPAGDAAYAEYYEQGIEWADCGSTSSGAALECGTVSVPRVWEDPSAGDVELAVSRRAADGEATGSLVVNPGGPGGSGVDFVESTEFLLSPQVRASYDVVGFDPRGVGASEGIECLSDQELDERRASSDLPLTEQGFADLTTWTERTAEGCEQDSADLLPYMDTLSAARDMDVLRAALGSEQLDYLGYSYGTFLGSTYAELYPDRVGAFVLDGALDPSLSADQIAAGQAQAFEQATDTFIESCLELGDQCPLKGEPAEAKQQLLAFLAALEDNPLPTGDDARPLTASLARSGLLLLMYEDALWESGRQALAAAMSGDGAPLLALADQSANRQLDGTYSGNSNVAITAVNCLDRPGAADLDWQRQEAQRLAEEFPTFGPSFGFSGYACSLWPAQPVREPAPVSAEGAGPIVVIGTTGDPATPYAWSEALAGQLNSSVLLTYEGEGHTAYGRSGGCIEEMVDAYLLEGTVPEDGARC